MRISCTCYTPSALQASDATKLERPPKKRGVLVASRPAARLKKSLIGRRRYPIRKLERRVASRARGLDGCGDFNSFVASLQMVFLSVFHDAFMFYAWS